MEGSGKGLFLSAVSKTSGAWKPPDLIIEELLRKASACSISDISHS